MTTPNTEETALQAAPASESQETTTETKRSKASRQPKGGAPSAKGATARGKANKKTTPAKKTPKAAKGAKSSKTSKFEEKAGAVREGSKTAIVLSLIQRTKGATLAEIMEATSWQAHSVRGFISGTLGKKMGLKVESAKREDGTRFYSLLK